MNIRDLRFVTILAVIRTAICGFTMVRGWTVMVYAITQSRVAADASKVQALSGWTSVSGVGSLAQEAMLQKSIDPRDRKAATEELEREAVLLSVRPLSPQTWLSTAVMRMLSGVTTDKVEGALAMSSLTGPNEGYLMMSRGIFGLSLWESLRPETRKIAANDIAGAASVGTLYTPQEWTNYRNSLAAVFSSKNQNVRRDILNALLETNRLSDADFTRIGISRE